MDVGDSKFKGKYVQNTQNQPGISRVTSAPIAINEIKSNDYPHQLDRTQPKQFKKAPHEFFGGSRTASMSTPNFYHRTVEELKVGVLESSDPATLIPQHKALIRRGQESNQYPFTDFVPLSHGLSIEKGLQASMHPKN